MAESYSGLTRKRVEVPAYSLATVEFFDTQPNYFRVTNQGDGKIYLSTTRTPNPKTYDFACDARSITMHSEPYARKTLMVFNPTGSAVEVDILSFYAPFDPLALAFSAIKLDFSATSLETSTSIDSFKTSLPEGDNKIGRVEVDNFPTDYARASGQKDYTAAIANIDNKITELKELYNHFEKRYNFFKSGTATTAEETISGTTGFNFIEICFLSNDGDGDITVTTVDYGGDTYSMVVKSGEVLNHIPCCCPTIKISGNGEYRLALAEVEV